MNIQGDSDTKPSSFDYFVFSFTSLVIRFLKLWRKACIEKMSSKSDFLRTDDLALCSLHRREIPPSPLLPHPIMHHLSPFISYLFILEFVITTEVGWIPTQNLFRIQDWWGHMQTRSYEKLYYLHNKAFWGFKGRFPNWSENGLSEQEKESNLRCSFFFFL